MILFPKWFEVIRLIDNARLQKNRRNYIERMIRDTDVSVTFLKQCINLFEEEGIIKRVQFKTRKYIHLTSKGKEVALCVQRLMSIIENGGVSNEQTSSSCA